MAAVNVSGRNVRPARMALNALTSKGARRFENCFK